MMVMCQEILRPTPLFNFASSTNTALMNACPIYAINMEAMIKPSIEICSEIRSSPEGTFPKKTNKGMVKMAMGSITATFFNTGQWSKKVWITAAGSTTPASKMANAKLVFMPPTFRLFTPVSVNKKMTATMLTIKYILLNWTTKHRPIETSNQIVTPNVSVRWVKIMGGNDSKTWKSK